MSKATKKVRDKWRAKEWYSVFTPSYFGEMSVASIPVEDPKKLIGRVVETTLYEITNDFAHQSTKLYFLVVANKGDRCDTILKSHEYSTDYLRSLVRRGSTRMDGIFTASTIDKYLTRVYTVAFSHGRIKGSQEHAVRQVMGKTGKIGGDHCTQHIFRTRKDTNARPRSQTDTRERPTTLKLSLEIGVHFRRTPARRADHGLRHDSNTRLGLPVWPY